MNSYQFLLVVSLTLLIALSSEARPALGLNSLFALPGKSVKSKAPDIAQLTDSDDTLGTISTKTKDIKVDEVPDTADEAAGSLVRKLDVLTVDEVLADADDSQKAADAEERR